MMKDQEQSNKEKHSLAQLIFPLSPLVLRKFILCALLDLSLDPQQQRRLPLVQLAHLIVRIQLV